MKSVLKNPVWLAFCAGILYMYAVMLYFDYMETLEREKIQIVLTTNGNSASDDNKGTDTPTTETTRNPRQTKRTRGKIMSTSVSAT
jgi:hypothetical protein